MTKLYHKNPRKITDKKMGDLDDTLTRLGDLSGIVHDLGTDEIVGGNQRSKVFRLDECEIVLTEEYAQPDEQGTVGLGYVIWKGKKYSYRQVRWDARTAEEANIVANKAAGEWNFEMLATEFNTDDLLTWGFEPVELGIVEVLEAPLADPGAQVDRAEELREKWGVELGQMWQLGAHRLICGDCTDAAVVARVMSGEKAALAWFDPPFGIDLQPQRQKTNAIENDGKAEAQTLWAKFLPLLKGCMSPDTHLFLCQGWSEFDWTLPLVRSHFTIKSKVVWSKNVWGIGYYTRPKHEDILYCWNGKPPTIDEPVADVWDVARESAPTHAAEKPPQLSGIAIEHFSKHGDIVADWFCGVGGSLIACEQLSRKCRAVEISPAYVSVSLQRFYDMTGVMPVLLEDS